MIDQAEHYGWQGLAFETVRGAALLGDHATAERVHRQIGDHSPNQCPVCTRTLFPTREPGKADEA